MAEALSKESLLEYVKKQKQKIKKLEQELIDERGKVAASPYPTAMPDLSALQDEISGGISAFFGITAAASTITEPAAIKNGDGAMTVEALTTLLATKEAEAAANLQKEKKFKIIIKTKMKEIEEKDKEIKHFQDLISANGSGQIIQSADNAILSTDSALQQKIIDLTAQLENEKQKEKRRLDEIGSDATGESSIFPPMFWNLLIGYSYMIAFTQILSAYICQLLILLYCFS